MDTLRGTFGSDEPVDAAGLDDTLERHETESLSGSPAAPQTTAPANIGQDERRMQVRAYNHWASLLEDRVFPLIEELDPANLPDFGPYSVLIDFTGGIEDPAVQFLGDRLAAECGAGGSIHRLSDVPPRSLLSRITDHYLQILANQAPIGFEAEFVSQRGLTTLYRGILLPYSSDGETIDFLYGVINWKELADQVAADELLLEIDQALNLVEEPTDDDGEDVSPVRRAPDPVTNWADSPASDLAPSPEAASPAVADMQEASLPAFANVASLTRAAKSDAMAADDLPVPQFGLVDDVANDFDEADFSHYALDEDFDDDEEDEEDDTTSYNFASLADYLEPPVKKAIDPAAFALDESALADEADDSPARSGPGEEWGLHEPAETDLAADYEDADDDNVAHDAADYEGADYDNETDVSDLLAALPSDASLYDCLAAARELARAAHASEDRGRSALYAAISRAYDFSLAALAAPEDYAELIAEAGLIIQERAPMTPVVKLVFGADYDKTRLTEYAAVLSHAHRLTLERGTLARFLEDCDGGLKAVVKAERRVRRGEAVEELEQAGAMREALAEALRGLEALTLEALDGGGPEFALVLVRRDEVGCVEILGELPEDADQIERAARKLVG